MNNSVITSVNKNRQEIINQFKIKLSAAILLLTWIFTFNTVQAQVNVNIGSQVLWGPVGYDYVEYYYLPQEDVYYNVPTGQFIYLNGPNWTFANQLPSRYHTNLYTTYKVVVNEPNPYLKHHVYVTKYAQYKHGGPKQMVIRDSDDARYYVVKGHPKNRNGNNGNSDHNKVNNVNHNSNNNQNDHNKTQPLKAQKTEGHQQHQEGSVGGGHNGGNAGGNSGGHNKH